jgi:pimeloyl-ACP methyl ester carboxylesterase
MQIEALADEFTVIAWDGPGTGRSGDPPGAFGMAEWADLLDAFLVAVDIGGAHILGQSFGGSLALALLDRHPERAASLILADAYAGWKGSLSAAECARRLEFALNTAELSPDELIAQWLPQLLSPAVAPGFAEELASIMRDSRPAGLRSIAHAMAESDLSAVLPRIRVPTLLLWGEEDERSPVSIARHFHATIPGSRLVLIPGAGHDSNIEQPERFSEAVREFCRSVRAAA